MLLPLFTRFTFTFAVPGVSKAGATHVSRANNCPTKPVGCLMDTVAQLIDAAIAPATKSVYGNALRALNLFL